MSLSLEDVSKFAFENLSQCTSRGGHNWIARCPFCGDSKKNKHLKRFHLEYLDDSARFHCFNCEASGSFYTLYAHVMGVSINEAISEFRKFDPSRIKQQFKRITERVISSPVETEVKFFDWIKDDVVDLTSSDLSYKEKQLKTILESFRINRRIDLEYPLYITSKGPYASRIIIPVMEEGHIVYFQGRAILKDQFPKYLNPVSEKSNIILNKNYFNPDKPIIITEGLIDAMSIEDHQGTSCLGAVITEEFTKILNKYTSKGIIIALDNDETGKKNLKKLLDSGMNAKFFMMPSEFNHCKDLNDVKLTGELESVYDFVLENSYNAFRASVLLKLEK